MAVLASGRGSNLQALLEAYPADNALGRVVLVLSNRPGALALERALSGGIEGRYVPWPSRAEFEAEAQRRLQEAGVDVVCLAGFMRLLSPEFTEAWAGRLLNIHPSLLPAFPGLDAQGQALRAGATESGCTVHLVDAGVDSGPIILQRPVPVVVDDDVESLTERILHAEHVAYPEALRRVLAGEWP